MTPTILAVEDEPAILELLRVNLVDAGYAVRSAADAETARAMLKESLPDLLLLDWMLPGQSGLALAKQLRADARTRDIPIIMVTARSDEADKIAGLEAWVDDYVTKPFSPRELRARIKAVMRRRAPESALETLSAGSLALDPRTHRVTVDGRAVHLGPTEFRLLKFLLARPERVHSRAQLQDQVWGDQVYIEERTVDVHIRRLRTRARAFRHGFARRDRQGERLPPCRSAMKPVLRRGLAAPVVVAFVTLVVWGVFGPRWALAALAIGAGAIIGFHLYYLQRATDWAAGPLDARVPEGGGSWAEAFSALHRRTRMRETVQRDLRHVIQRFRKAAEALPDGVVLLDAYNRIDWANVRAEAQLGLNLATDRRQPLVNLVRQPEFLRYVESGDYREPVLVEQPLKRRTLSLQLVPFGMEEKLLLSRDVTQLEAVARMRRDFIANVSHELKTPLTVITGFVETLQDMEFEPAQRARYLGLMEDQARNMQRLVDDLLALSSLESEHNPVQDTEFAAGPLLLELSADAKALSHSEHAIALDAGVGANIVGNRDELKSAIGNLVSNAIRYTPQRGAITIAWRIDEDGSGVFSVRDTGIGIAPEHIPRLTERFYRVDRSRSRATGGTGLGLAIVKHVLLRHQAELAIESRPGEGSVFSVRLPARRVRRAEPPAGASGAESASRSARPAGSGR